MNSSMIIFTMKLLRKMGFRMLNTITSIIPGHNESFILITNSIAQRVPLNQQRVFRNAKNRHPLKSFMKFQRFEGPSTLKLRGMVVVKNTACKKASCL